MKDITSDYWVARHRAQGKDYVSRRGVDNYEEQRKIITAAVRSELDTARAGHAGIFHALDFGCGVGRFHNLLWEYVDALDALDWVDSALAEVRRCNADTNVVRYDELPLPLAEGKYNLVWLCMVLQHVVSPERFNKTCQQIGEAAAPGAKFILIENASDRAPHVILRTPETYAAALGFSITYAEPLEIDKPNSHWLIVGRKEEVGE